MTDSAYRAALTQLYQRRRFGMKPGLEVIRALLEALDHPEEKFTAIHVTGSKGKGSVSAMAAAFLASTGRRTGLFISPHLQTYRERVRVAGSPIPKAEVVRGLRRIESESDRLERRGAISRAPTFFEVTTALGFDWFRRAGVTDAVVEVGLGGRLDSTNVLNAPVGVVTTVELEHTDILGPTLSDIAREKAGIFRAGMSAVTGERKPEPAEVLRRTADALGVPLWKFDEEVRVVDRALFADGQRLTVSNPHRTLERVRLPMLGSFQAPNLAVALAAVDRYAESVGLRLSNERLRAAVAKLVWRGRMERVARGPDLYLDVAHTPESAHAVVESLGEIDPMTDPAENAILFGCLQGKHVGQILPALGPVARTLVVTPIRSDRSITAEELRRAAVGSFPCVVQARNSVEGLALARAATGPRGLTLVTGSDYLVGEVLNRLEGTPHDEPDLSDPALRGPGLEVVGKARGRGR